jgi:hypothetical protein
MASSDDRLRDFNENTVGPRPLMEEEIRGIPADQYAIYPEYEGRWRPRCGARDLHGPDWSVQRRRRDLSRNRCGFPRFRGQVSGASRCEFICNDELLLVIYRAEIPER